VQRIAPLCLDCLFFVAWILGSSSSFCILALLLLCMQRKLHCYAWILTLLCMQRKDCTAMLGFLHFFACRERIALLVCLDSCSSLLHTEQCHLWLNCTSVLGFLLFFFACRERIALLYLDSCSTSKGSQSHVIHWKESSAFLCIFDKFSSESKDLNYHMHFSNGFQTVASSSA